MALFKDGQTPVDESVVGIHEVHPVAAVVQVILRQGGNTEHIFIAQSHSGKGHVVSPDHVDFGNDWVGHQVEDAIPRPSTEKADTKEEG